MPSASTLGSARSTAGRLARDTELGDAQRGSHLALAGPHDQLRIRGLRRAIEHGEGLTIPRLIDENRPELILQLGVDVGRCVRQTPTISAGGKSGTAKHSSHLILQLCHEESPLAFVVRYASVLPGTPCGVPLHAP
jgi:hypothetical protein